MSIWMHGGRQTATATPPQLWSWQDIACICKMLWIMSQWLPHVTVTTPMLRLRQWPEPKSSWISWIDAALDLGENTMASHVFVKQPKWADEISSKRCVSLLSKTALANNACRRNAASFSYIDRGHSRFTWFGRRTVTALSSGIITLENAIISFASHESRPNRHATDRFKDDEDRIWWKKQLRLLRMGMWLQIANCKHCHLTYQNHDQWTSIFLSYCQIKQ